MTSVKQICECCTYDSSNGPYCFSCTDEHHRILEQERAAHEALMVEFRKALGRPDGSPPEGLLGRKLWDLTFSRAPEAPKYHDHGARDDCHPKCPLAPKPDAREQVLKSAQHILACTEVWEATGVSRVRAITREANAIIAALGDK